MDWIELSLSKLLLVVDVVSPLSSAVLPCLPLAWLSSTTLPALYVIMATQLGACMPSLAECSGSPCILGYATLLLRTHSHPPAANSPAFQTRTRACPSPSLCAFRPLLNKCCGRRDSILFCRLSSDGTLLSSHLNCRPRPRPPTSFALTKPEDAPPSSPPS
jgi:hypothetical protein